jgi:hypothetical protein
MNQPGTSVRIDGTWVEIWNRELWQWDAIDWMTDLQAIQVSQEEIDTTKAWMNDCRTDCHEWIRESEFVLFEGTCWCTVS